MADRQITDAIREDRVAKDAERESAEFELDDDVVNIYAHIDRKTVDQGGGQWSTDFPDKPGVPVADVWVEVSYDGGATWEFGGGFPVNGGMKFARDTGAPVLFDSLFTMVRPERGFARRCRLRCKARDLLDLQLHLELVATNPKLRHGGSFKPPGSVGFVDSISAASTTTSVTTGNIVVGSGETLAVKVGGDADTGGQPDEVSATWNGGGGEDIPLKATGQSTYTLLSLYGLERPTAGTDTVTGTITGNQTESCHTHALVLSDVDATTGFSDAIVTTNATSVDVGNMTADDMVVGAAISEDGPAYTSPAEQTDAEATGPIGTYDSEMLSSYETGTGTVTHSYTPDGGEYFNITGAMRVIAAAAAAPSGTGSLSFGPIQIAASGGLEYAATGSLTFPRPSLSGQGLMHPEGTASLTFPRPGISASGQLVFSATGSLSFQKPSISASGELKMTATGSLSFQKPTISAIGVMHPAATGLLSYGPIAINAVGEQPLTGEGSMTFPRPGLSASGLMHPEAAGSMGFGPIRISASGAEQIAATASMSFGGPSFNASGTMFQGFTGTGSLSFGTIQISADGSIVFAATAGLTFGPIAMSAAGNVEASQPYQLFQRPMLVNVGRLMN